MIDCESVGGVFMIRISALVGDTVPGPANPCDILGYNIYRREYSSFPAGPNQQGSGEYNWIGSVPFGTNEFVDRDISNIDNNCFEYRLTMQYIDGEGSEAGSAWSCIYVSQKELQKDEVNIYPNPANEFLIIESNSNIETITVYNLTGSQVAKLFDLGTSSTQLNVSHFAPGMYNIRFNTAKDESFNRKFIKL
jgi:hypothetical protein